MTLKSQYLVFPEGDRQEIEHSLRVNQIVDLNGNVLPLPLRNPKIIAYRIVKVRTVPTLGEENTYYYLELVPVTELSGL